MKTYKVIGTCLVDGKSKGEIITLDPGQFNIPALIEAGHVEPVARKPRSKEASSD